VKMPLVNHKPTMGSNAESHFQERNVRAKDGKRRGRQTNQGPGLSCSSGSVIASL
jgi:hypothetical protein